MSSDSGDGTTGPAAKKQKTYEADGPVEDDKTAREKLKAAGFDPDDVHTARSDVEPPAQQLKFWFDEITPMTYFAYYGDLPMCRYLHHLRDASTSENNPSKDPEYDFWCPMYAAVHKNRIPIAKWLFTHGANEDVGRTRRNDYSWTPFGICFHNAGIGSFELPFSRERNTGDSVLRTDLGKWFILNGAMDGRNGHVDYLIVKDCLRGVTDLEECWYGPNRLQSFLLEWSDDLIQKNDTFRIFLRGNLSAPEYSVQALQNLCAKKLGSAEAALLVVQGAIAIGNCRAVWDKLLRTYPTNSCLAPFPGIVENIAEYVGFTKSKSKMKRLKEFRAIISMLTVEDLEAEDSEPEDVSEYEWPTLMY